MTDTAGPQFILGGRTEPGSSPFYQGMRGFYWSSSAHTDTTNAYRLRLVGTDSTVYPAHSGGKYYGNSLRCLGQ